jgi:predicted metal-dependent RNase
MIGLGNQKNCAKNDGMKQFVGLQYDRSFDIADDIKLTFRDAGHILGFAGILLKIK